MIKKPTFGNRLLTFILCLLFFAYSLLSLRIGSPIFGSDEYAFFISGKYFDRIQELYIFDPGLQRISNVLYLKILFHLNAWTGPNFVFFYRFIHLIEYSLTALFLYKIFIRIFDKKTTVLGLFAFIVLPSAIYIQSVMPEIELILISVILGYILVLVFPKNGTIGAVLGGVTIASSVLIKPHGAALLLVALAFIASSDFFKVTRNGHFKSLNNIFLLLGSAYLGFILLWKFSTGDWAGNPLLALSLNLYGPSLTSNSQAIGFLGKVQSALMYFGAHFIVLALIFLPSFIWIFKTLLVQSRKSEAKFSSNESSIALFTFLLVCANIAMTSWFTAGAAAVWPGEGMRLHGRYLGSSIAFLPFIYFYYLSKIKDNFEKKYALGVVAIVSICAFFLFEHFKIFPWDHPVLFAFFKYPNHYNWTFIDGINSLGSVLLSIICLISLFSLFNRKYLYSLMTIQLFIILLVGCHQTYGWVERHTRNNAPLTMYAREASSLLATDSFGKGLVISSERYGRMSYILFGIANSPKVLEKSPDSSITKEDVSGVDWVLLGEKYLINFDYLDAVEIGPLKLIRMKQ